MKRMEVAAIFYLKVKLNVASAIALLGAIRKTKPGQSYSYKIRAGTGSQMEDETVRKRML
jgi:hypothetical protein